MRSVFTKKDLAIVKEKYEQESKIPEAKVRSEAAHAETSKTEDEEPGTDNYLNAIVGFIPGLPVAVFTSLLPMIKGAAETTPVDLLSYGLFVFCLLLTVIMTYVGASNEKITYKGHVFNVPGKYIKTLYSTLAFIIWAFNIEAFFSNFKNYDPVVANMCLVGFTLLAPSLYSILPEKLRK